jgi:hypothetical protein
VDGHGDGRFRHVSDGWEPPFFYLLFARGFIQRHNNKGLRCSEVRG